MMKRALAGIGVVLVFQVAGVSSVLADPPGPPPPPTCKYCEGPPPPPTPVATVGPTLLPALPAVDVHLAPTHVSRGHTAKIEVSAQQSAAVTIAVMYRGWKKSRVSHSKVGVTGTLVKTWKVPKSAPLGDAQIKVMVSGQSQAFNLALTVTK
jgi:hypothetical protein